jgi:hypothetical protein
MNLEKIFIGGCLIIAGCASYHFGHYKRALPGGYDRVAIPMFVNKSEEVGIEAYFTESLRTEFERSRLAKVTSKNDAQVILEGTITGTSFMGNTPIQPYTPELNTPDKIQTPLAGPPASPTPTPNPNPLPANTLLNKFYSATVSAPHRQSQDIQHQPPLHAEFKTRYCSRNGKRHDGRSPRSADGEFLKCPL